MRRPFEERARCFGVLMGLRRARVILRDCLLVAAEHIHPEPLARVKMSVGARAMIHADQHQRRIERHRCECVRRHAVDFTILVYGNDRDAGREASHRFAEIVSGQVHVRRPARRPPDGRASPFRQLNTLPRRTSARKIVAVARKVARIQGTDLAGFAIIVAEPG